jgi:hypothetical protein
MVWWLGYVLHGRRFVVRFPGGTEIFFSAQAPAKGGTIPWGFRRQNRKADNWFSLSAMFKMLRVMSPLSHTLGLTNMRPSRNIIAALSQVRACYILAVLRSACKWRYSTWINPSFFVFVYMHKWGSPASPYELCGPKLVYVTTAWSVSNQVRRQYTFYLYKL